MRFSLRTLLKVTAVFAVLFVAALKVIRDYIADINEQPTAAVLDKLDLDARFKNITPTMDDDDVFRVLGLSRYQQFLMQNSKVTMDGAGGNWQYFIKDSDGYTFAFRDFFGTRSCCIRTPKSRSLLKTETSTAKIDLSRMSLN